MGLDDFKGSGTCSVTRPNATTVSVNGSSVFAGNMAKLQGGAIAVQSGTLLLQVSHIQGCSSSDGTTSNAVKHHCQTSCTYNCATHPDWM